MATFQELEAMRHGAVDFLEKPVDHKALLEAVHRATERTRTERKLIVGLESLQRRFQSLTPREREVFGLVTSGLINKQAGEELGTREKTIKVHRARVMLKMNAESLAELVRMAERLNVRPPDKSF